ncbi:tetratricopeptide repeat protein [Erythrobacter sp. HKB08]|uniref:tetratricopeptide repeat protein n=1 Tax=Erythrobacter sp. HKB08 TaxID=2502843 RepID=UPI0010089941|nr:tetratricopeptide repeat protein [Erythrobacter sp. HKB08]
MSGLSAQGWYNKAAAAAQSGDNAGAHAILRDALAAYPREAQLWHGAGNVLLSLGEPVEAAEHFGKAYELAPGQFDFAIDQAIALSNANRHHDALKVLKRIETQAAAFAHYCSTRANAERGAGHAEAAAKWYDRALSIEPARPKALVGRASVALERGEADALARFDRALQHDPGNPYLWLGKAQALDVLGETTGARNIMEQVVQQAPAWPEGLQFLAQLRLAAGEEDFTSHYGDAAAKVPQDPNILDAWCRTLAGLDYNEQATEVAARAHKAFPDKPHFALLEAVYAGAAGDDDRAEEIFAEFQIDALDWHVHETRHRIRRGEYDLAEALLDKAVAHSPDDIGAWALRGIVWRLTGDPREEWLHHQEGLHELRPLHDAERVLPPAIALLHRLHDNSPLPLGQSLRGGSQTRGILFHRTEPEIAALHEAILATVEEHRSKMPPADPAHPILRHRDAPWHITGSWSVRLSGGGDFHTSHIHPQGVISSALYCQLPELGGDDSHAGWLELGRPPPDLRLDLGPIRMIEPREAHLALFPSTLYHGTRPFESARRMTVAFDVSLVQG